MLDSDVIGDVESDVISDVVSDVVSDVICDVESDVISDIFGDVLSDVLSRDGRDSFCDVAKVFACVVLRCLIVGRKGELNLKQNDEEC